VYYIRPVILVSEYNEAEHTMKQSCIPIHLIAVSEYTMQQNTLD